ncbi:MAG: YkgJ family cysteine cluster protein [Candidatus Hodarchaeota archaeon]
MDKETVDGRICKQQNCHHCCVETEMLLTKKDIQRIVKLTSIPAKEFVTLNEYGYKELKNKQTETKLQCYFLDQKGQCSIYENRPEGCQFYPYIWDLTEQRITIDDQCLYHSEFPKPWLNISKCLEEFIFRLFGKL